MKINFKPRAQRISLLWIETVLGEALGSRGVVCMRLDVGCGEKPTGDVNVDIRVMKPGPSFFIHAYAKNLPFRSAVFDHVYASHVLEHIGIMEIDEVIGEWNRVLKQNGILEIKCPNLRSISVLKAIFFATEFEKHGLEKIYGQSEDYPEDLHRSGFTPRIVKKLLSDHRFTEIDIKYLGEYTFLPFFKNRVIRSFYRKIRLTTFPRHFLDDLHISARKPRK